ncbi:MAG: hypothetical protein JXA89_21460 [Anaerolineae bacterium]|nr:hypothetical protein [Anaerolineae bacterium]
MNTKISIIKPEALRAVGGFLGQRFHANRETRLKDRRLAEGFVRLHERKTIRPAHAYVPLWDAGWWSCCADVHRE